MTGPRILIAGGGTGGHLFPGIALAEEVKTRHPRNEVLFVGSPRGLEVKVVPASGFQPWSAHASSPVTCSAHLTVSRPQSPSARRKRASRFSPALS